MLLLCSQRFLGSSAYISPNGNQSICSSDLKGSMVCLVWGRKKFARQGWDLVPTYSQKDVEKVRAIVVPTYASGKQRDVSKRQTNVILMKNVSNLFHHIHFWKVWLFKIFRRKLQVFCLSVQALPLTCLRKMFEKIIESFNCKHWVFCLSVQALPLTIKRCFFVWKEFEKFLIVCDVIDEILLP